MSTGGRPPLGDAGVSPDRVADDDEEDDAFLRALARAPDVPIEDELAADLIGRAIGPFRVTGRLGRGGMGTVYAALDPVAGREVALKVLVGGEREGEHRRRFLREARAASAIAHPNVAAVHTAGEHEGHIFIAMERVAGETLRSLLRRQPGARLPVGRALGVARQIAGAVAAAHQVGVIHRDLKPENVMVEPSGAVKVVDFGLAKHKRAVAPDRSRSALSDFRTEAGRVIGTAGYMSPEQAEGMPVDERTDVFSFGVILYEVIAGARPFRGETPVKVRLAMEREPAAPLAEQAEGVHPELSSLVDRCLARDPGRRYADGAALEAALAGLPEPAQGGGWLARAKRILGG